MSGYTDNVPGAKVEVDFLKELIPVLLQAFNFISKFVSVRLLLENRDLLLQFDNWLLEWERIGAAVFC